MPFFLLSAFIFLILHPESSFEGVKSGLELWFQIVLPTLFPFLILIGLMLSHHVPERIGQLVAPLLHQTPFRETHLFPMMVGLLSGYPSGAKTLNDMVLSKNITKEEAQWLLCFCNNVSPAFFLNYVFVQTLPVGNQRFFLLFLLYLSAFLSSLPFYPKKKKESVPAGCKQAENHPEAPLAFDDILTNTCEILVKVGCYIMLFSLISQVMGLYLKPYPVANLLLRGFLEITNGIGSLRSLPSQSPLLLPIAMGFCAFGGLSALFQSFSVIRSAGLSKKKYAVSKLLNTAWCVLFVLILNAF